jgi:hypothetical protein
LQLIRHFLVATTSTCLQFLEKRANGAYLAPSAYIDRLDFGHRMAQIDREPYAPARTADDGSWVIEGPQRIDVVTSPLRSLRGFECYGLIAEVILSNLSSPPDGASIQAEGV